MQQQYCNSLDEEVSELLELELACAADVELLKQLCHQYVHLLL